VFVFKGARLLKIRSCVTGKLIEKRKRPGEKAFSELHRLGKAEVS